MTDFYGAFLASTSKFMGQIQTTNIDTNYKSILTCLSNNEKIKKKYIPEQNASPSCSVLDIFELEIVYSLNFLITIDLRRGCT